MIKGIYGIYSITNLINHKRYIGKGEIKIRFTKLNLPLQKG
jgi:hypothetical protein